MDLPVVEGGLNEGRKVKVIGHQWYWRYEYQKRFRGKYEVYDSFMVPENELRGGGFRLLETDKPLLLPLNHHSFIQGVTSDVIHRWTCPPLGVKIDVIPGRLNTGRLIPLELGVYYGQCSEICGANHSFMPIEVEVITGNAGV